MTPRVREVFACRLAPDQGSVSPSAAFREDPEADVQAQANATADRRRTRCHNTASSHYAYRRLVAAGFATARPDAPACNIARTSAVSTP
jgi:hypothetical protein